MKKIAIVIVLLIQLSLSVKSQFANAFQLETQLKKAIKIAYASSVRIWGFDTVRRVQNSAQFSGVVVDKTGTILSVSHAVQPNKTYKVRFPDGREAIALSLGRIGLQEQDARPDLAMLKIVGDEVWPSAEMGWSSSLKIDEPCIGISYPETLNQLLPTVRFGIIRNPINEAGFVHSTCKMEPGDSGGPLFDYMGRVIGIHSRCLPEEDGNFEVPIDAYRKYWTALSIAKDYKILPTDHDEITTDPIDGRISTVPFAKHLEKSFSSLNRYQKSIVKIFSKTGSIEQVVEGTAFEINRMSYLVSKSSLVTDTAWIEQNNRKLNVRVLKRDNDNDLVLISLPIKLSGALAANMLEPLSDFGAENLGSFLISPLPGGLRVSMLSSMAIDMPKKFSAGFFGAGSVFRNGKVTVTRIIKGSPAEIIGVNIGDQIDSINKIPMTSADKYNSEMNKYMPGEMLTLTMVRDGKQLNSRVTLGISPLAHHAANKFKGGKSVRLDGFRQVFSHDAVIQPQECGGPVFDSMGRFSGINIARFSRTSVIAVPTKTVAEFINRTLNIEPAK
ncbi:MAG: trypsin-like peptidase domain-containing protein [Bacteroidota bacterium]